MEVSRNQKDLDNIMERLRGKVERVMLDIMDGVFVLNRSVDFEFELPGSFEYEVHMMIVNPLECISEMLRRLISPSSMSRPFPTPVTR